MDPESITHLQELSFNLSHRFVSLKHYRDNLIKQGKLTVDATRKIDKVANQIKALDNAIHHLLNCETKIEQ